ncbi:MAG: ATP-binding cassette domain-containing protein [Rhodobacteraceae bacterium]|jgi:putative ABC transport system ATP-binding protein|nr:ATP-binding cassette domain-containing protein [Paracoccaceae bacterium]
MDPVIAAQGVTVTLRDGAREFRLEMPDLTLAPGGAVALTGASGTGKTLLLEVLGLLRRPDPGGRLTVRGPGGAVDLAQVWAATPGRVPALRGGAFGFIPQQGGLIPFLTLAETLSLVQRIAGRPDPAHARRLADRLGIADLLPLRPDRLSIGQRQRGAIAAALAHRPAVVIADEPTAALDPANAAEALGLILEMAADTGAAVLLSSHDLDLVGRFPVARRRLEIVPGTGPGGTADRVVSRLSPPDTARPEAAMAAGVRA